MFLGQNVSGKDVFGRINSARMFLVGYLLGYLNSGNIYLGETVSVNPSYSHTSSHFLMTRLLLVTLPDQSTGSSQNLSKVYSHKTILFTLQERQGRYFKLTVNTEASTYTIYLVNKKITVNTATNLTPTLSIHK